MEYTDEERYENYRILVKTITEIQQRKITEDWFYEHKDLISLYRDRYHDYSQVNPEVSDPQFRMIVTSIESLLCCICDQIRHQNIINLEAYLQLNIMIKSSVDFLLKGDEVDELSKYMEKMGV
jgi:hypothetical protein